MFMYIAYYTRHLLIQVLKICLDALDEFQRKYRSERNECVNL